MRATAAGAPTEVSVNPVASAGLLGVFEKIYIFSPSVNIDDSWIPVKKYIEEDLGVNTERKQAYYDEWDEAALRGIIQRLGAPSP